MKLLKRKNLWSIMLFVIIVGGVAVYYSIDFTKSNTLSQERLKALRVEYPIVYGTLPNAETIELSFSDVLKVSQTAVVAEVIEKLPEYTLDLVADETTPEGVLNEKQENLGFSFSKANFTPYKVRVNEVIAGDPVQEYVNIVNNSDLKEFEPELTPGTKIVVTLFKAPSHPEGNYGFTKYGTYYVVDDDYVLSAYESKEQGEMSFASKVMNGKPLKALKEEIRDFKNN
ncbi:hypothetical protein D3C74_229120 [compost metagenome]